MKNDRNEKEIQNIKLGKTIKTRDIQKIEY